MGLKCTAEVEADRDVRSLNSFITFISLNFNAEDGYYGQLDDFTLFYPSYPTPSRLLQQGWATNFVRGPYCAFVCFSRANSMKMPWMWFAGRMLFPLGLHPAWVVEIDFHEAV